MVIISNKTDIGIAVIYVPSLRTIYMSHIDSFNFGLRNHAMFYNGYQRYVRIDITFSVETTCIIVVYLRGFLFCFELLLLITVEKLVNNSLIILLLVLFFHSRMGAVWGISFSICLLVPSPY